MKEKIESKVVGEQIAFEGNWLGLKYIAYSIGEKVVPSYETVYRTTTKKSGRNIDGVEVIPVIKYKSGRSQIVLIANFRPPVNNFVLEFPSGLLQDENYEQNARREVLEETGLKIEKFVKIPYPVMHCDPWKSNQSGLFYIGIVNGDDPQHQGPQHLQNEQNIMVHKLELSENLMSEVKGLAEQKGYVLEGKVWSICVGLAIMNLVK